MHARVSVCSFSVPFLNWLMEGVYLLNSVHWWMEVMTVVVGHSCEYGVAEAGFTFICRLLWK